jgi:transcriptional regulator with XRE-family HTH domain
VPQVSHKLSPSWLKAVGHRLGEAMSDADFTQKDLEHASGVSQGNISLLLNAGRETGGTLLNAIRLANALRVRVGWLLEGEGPKRSAGITIPPKPTLVDPKAELIDADEESGSHVPVRAKHAKK